MIMKDIVYILKNDIKPEELRYSLRSVEKNFYHRFVWFYGGCPAGITPDRHVNVIQQGYNKWEKVNYTLRKICENDDISEDFWLFNDDFFIMQNPLDSQGEMPPMTRGTISAHILNIKRKHNGADSNYSRQLKRTEQTLLVRGYDALDYALHSPILINRKKALETLDAFKGYPMFRSLYGNHHRIGGIIADDCKIQDTLSLPKGDEIFVSTNDKAFRNGRVGDYIRAQFPDKCKYEG